jgi:hypothetical protein
MIDKFYKLYMALRNNKILHKTDNYLITYDIKNARYNLWYIDYNSLPHFFDYCDNKITLKFKWNILMDGGTL